jgi:serpin B
MMTTTVKFLTLAPVALLLFACNENMADDNIKKPVSMELSSMEMRLVEEGQTFGMEFFAAVLADNKKDKKEDNIAVSPLSLSMALAMVWNGANSETRQAIQEAAGMGDYPEEEVNAWFKKLKEALLKTDPTTKLALANSIWAKKGFPFRESFYDVNRKWYDAKVSELDFSDPQSVNIINRWCSDNTGGLIKEMVREIPDNAVMYLMNALYFKGEWSKGFGFPKKNTKEADFHLENGQTVQVKMMSQTNQMPYYSDEYLALTSLPYGNGAFRMIFALPGDNVSFDEMIERLQAPAYLAACLNGGITREVSLYVPRFKTGYETVLNDPLKDLGMGIAFDPDLADFGRMSDIPLFISQVRQKTFIEVSEEGTEAAAVTSVEMALTSTGPAQPATFRANRPFMFLIQEQSSGTVLFMGKIGKAQSP